MKKIASILIASMMIAVLAGCPQPDSGEEGGGTTLRGNETEVAIYKSMLGTYVIDDYFNTNDLSFSKIILAENSISLGDSVYNFIPENDVIGEGNCPKDFDITKPSFYTKDYSFFLLINNKYYQLQFALNNPDMTSNEKIIKCSDERNFNPYDFCFVDIMSKYADDGYFEKSSSSGSGGSQSITLSGTYVIGEAHKSGNLVFSDGSWSLTRGTATGTYSLSGTTLTVNYSVNGTNTTADFTVSESSGTITLTGASGSYTAVLGGFGVSDQTALSRGAITLTLSE